MDWRFLEALRSIFKKGVLFRSTLRLPDMLMEDFAIHMSYGLASPVEICLVNGHPLLGFKIPLLSLLFLFGGAVAQRAGSLTRGENILNKEFHIILTLVLVLTLWNCVFH